MAIDATVAGASANSYLTLAAADNLALEHPNGDVWDGSLQQEQLLLTATRLLEQIDYIGVVSSDTQALKWPRYANDSGDLIRNYAINTIPMPIKWAEFEIALWIEDTGGVAVAAGTVESVQFGSEVTVKYAGESSSSSQATTGIDADGLPVSAAKYLRGLRDIAVLA